MNYYTLQYDSSIDGLLTAIFEVFEYKYEDVQISGFSEHSVDDIFAEKHKVITSSEKAQRVWKKLENSLGINGLQSLLKLYFSEHPRMEELFLYAVRESIKNPRLDILQNFGDEKILEIAQINKSMGREIHRMHAFVRFEKMKDGSFYAKIDPDFNVLPLAFKHFKERYTDQKWMIYDLRRNFGVYYDLHEAHFFTPESDDIQKFRNSSTLHHEEESQYQKMWQNYFIKTGIASRKNLKLHTQHIPKRYWKYLTEKQ